MSINLIPPCGGLLPAALLELLARAARARTVAVDLGPRRPRGPSAAPSAERFATLLARLKRFELTSGHAAAGSDQGFLQQYFRENEGFLSLPHAYNVLKRREKKLGKSFRIQDVFVLHLVGGKPWEPGDPGAGEYPLSHGAWHAIRRECGLPDDGY